MEPMEPRRIFRIILGACIDLTIFGVLIPWITIAAGRKLDAALVAAINLDSLFFDLIGIAFIVVGAGWFSWASLLLIRDGHGYLTELFCIEISPVTERLITHGPFAVHRHPICVGYLAILAGFSFLLGVFGALVVVIPLLLLLTYIYLRLFEEPCLRSRFGSDYQAYAERVHLFWPAKRNKNRIPVAFRNLWGDPLRFSVNVIGVSFAILLICFQLSILKGTRGQITTYIDHTGADIWAMQQGVDDFIATSTVARTAVQDLNKLDGVDRIAAIYAVYTLLEINQVKSRVYVVGYDTESGDGGPWKLGRTLPHLNTVHDVMANEILLDQNLAERHKLQLGDELSLFGHEFKIAGFTLETMSIGSQYAFVPRDRIAGILPGGEFSFTHILVWKKEDISDEVLIRRIEAATPLNALTREELADNMRDFLGMFMLPLLTTGVVMGFLVGCITIGITLYTSVLERFKEYGTIKAVGATDRYLYGLIFRQAMISLSFGIAIGLVLAVCANRLINEWVPGMTARLDGTIVMQTIAAGFFMAVVSTSWPMWRLLKLYPLEAFRA